MPKENKDKSVAAARSHPFGNGSAVMKKNNAGGGGGGGDKKRGVVPMNEQKKKMKKPEQRKGLSDELTSVEMSGIRTVPRQKKKNSKKHRDDEDLSDAEIDEKILRLAAEHEEQVAMEEGDEKRRGGGGAGAKGTVNVRSVAAMNWSDEDVEGDDDDEDEEEEEEEIEEHEYEEHEITEEEESVFRSFMMGGAAGGGAGAGQGRTIADLILEKLAEHNQNANTVPEEEFEGPPIDPKVRKVYTGVGTVLRTYRSGKVPKAFKVLPSLLEWRALLPLTRPLEWSPAAMAVGVRLFASSLPEKLARGFYRDVLLERVRDDIKGAGAGKRLNYHLFQALCKAAYKPAAFFQGIVLPLCESGDCSLREAVIIASVVKRVSFPAAHAAAALMHLAQMNYTGAQSVFMQILLDKKYALPRRAVRGVGDHFIGFVDDPRDMPVKWHHALLTFVQRYKFHIEDDQKEMLKLLLRNKTHHILTQEIRRELFSQPSQASMMITR